MAVHAQSAARGRPRNPAVDALILRAAFRMLIDLGYSAMSIEAVAAEAGVGKTTVYRRYPTKRDLVLAVLNALTTTGPITASDTRTAVGLFVQQSLGAPVAASGVRVMSALLLEEAREPELIETFRRRVLAPRRAVLAEVLRAGVERGEIRPDVDVDVTIEFVAGALIAHHVLALPVDGPWIAAVTDALWRSIAREP